MRVTENTLPYTLGIKKYNKQVNNKCSKSNKKLNNAPQWEACHGGGQWALVKGSKQSSGTHSAGMFYAKFCP